MEVDASAATWRHGAPERGEGVQTWYRGGMELRSSGGALQVCRLGIEEVWRYGVLEARCWRADVEPEPLTRTMAVLRAMFDVP